MRCGGGLGGAGYRTSVIVDGPRIRVRVRGCVCTCVLFRALGYGVGFSVAVRAVAGSVGRGVPHSFATDGCERSSHGAAGRGVSLFEQLIRVAGRRMGPGRPSTTATRQYNTNCYSVPRATVFSPHTTAARNVSLPSSVSRLTAAVRFGSLLSCCTKLDRA